MAAASTALHLLLLGALLSPAAPQQQQQQLCEQVKTATGGGSYTVTVSPAAYAANTTYNVTISGVSDNSSVILQALDVQNATVGQWEGSVGNSVDCNSTTILNNTTVQWKSPANISGSVDIRVFLVVSNNSTKVQSQILRTAESTTTATTKTSITATTSHGSSSTAQASSFLVAVVHLLCVLFTSNLFV